MAVSFWCVAHGHGSQWEGLCLDLDIAVQGQSLEQVKTSLESMIASYIEDAGHEDEATRNKLLGRRAPLSVRVPWALRLFFRSILSNRNRGSDETVGFPVSCPA
jgi:hypothetical protein